MDFYSSCMTFCVGSRRRQVWHLLPMRHDYVCKFSVHCVDYSAGIGAHTKFLTRLPSEVRVPEYQKEKYTVLLRRTYCLSVTSFYRWKRYFRGKNVWNRRGTTWKCCKISWGSVSAIEMKSRAWKCKMERWNHVDLWGHLCTWTKHTLFSAPYGMGYERCFKDFSLPKTHYNTILF